MNHFLDTEFNEDGQTITLISIALVCEDGRELYMVSNEFDPEACNDWVKANVLPKLPDRSTWSSRIAIRQAIEDFIYESAGHGHPKFWGYYADYDWVVFCWLWGAMVDLPKFFPYYCLDIKQLCDHLQVDNIKEVVPLPSNAHDALADARWNHDAYQWLKRRAAAVPLRL